MRAFVHYLYMQSAYGLTFLRLVTGGILFHAGYREVFKMGFAVRFFEQKGMILPHVVGPIVSVLDLVGGALLLAGLFTRYVAVVITVEYLLAAMATVYTLSLQHARFELTIVTGAIVLAMQGAGRFAADHPGRPWEPATDRRRGPPPAA